MATYADLISEVAYRMNRQGDPTLTSPRIAQWILDRITYFADELFYPSEKTDTSLVLIPGQALFTLPAGIKKVLKVRVLVSSTWMVVDRVDDYNDLLEQDLTQPGTQSIPWKYAMLGNQMRFFPRPTQPYTVEITGEMGIPLPVNQTDSNFWTNEAFTLIVESACEDISRLFISDEERADRHAKAVRRELMKLWGQTLKIQGPIQIKPYY